MFVVVLSFIFLETFMLIWLNVQKSSLCLWLKIVVCNNSRRLLCYWYTANKLVKSKVLKRKLGLHWDPYSWFIINFLEICTTTVTTGRLPKILWPGCQVNQRGRGFLQWVLTQAANHLISLVLNFLVKSTILIMRFGLELLSNTNNFLCVAGI